MLGRTQNTGAPFVGHVGGCGPENALVSREFPAADTWRAMPSAARDFERLFLGSGSAECTQICWANPAIVSNFNLRVATGPISDVGVGKVNDGKVRVRGVRRRCSERAGSVRAISPPANDRIDENVLRRNKDHTADASRCCISNSRSSTSPLLLQRRPWFCFASDPD